MAAADYRLCDVCDGKAFYDADLCYENGVSKFGLAPYRIAGKPQFSNPEVVSKHGLRLGYVGDWAVLCAECARTHRVQIVPIEQEQHHDNQD